MVSVFRSSFRSAGELLKGRYRTWSFWMLIVLALVMSSQYYLTTIFSEAYYMNAIDCLEAVFEIMLLVMLLMGLQMVRDTQDPAIAELQSTFPGRKAETAAGLILAVPAFTLPYSMLLGAVNCILVRSLYGLNGIYLLRCFAEYMLRFGIGLSVCGWAGECIAVWCRGKAAYVFLLLFWFLSGGQASSITGLVMNFSGGDFTDSIQGPPMRILHMLSLGKGSDSSYCLRDLGIGALIQPIRWIVRLCLTGWLVAFLAFSLDLRLRLSASRPRKVITYAVGAAVIPLFVCLYLTYGSFFVTHISTAATWDTHSVEYELWPGVSGSLDALPKDSLLTVTDNDISFSAKANGANIECRMTVTADQDLDGQIFTLDRFYTPASVQVNGTEADYQRDLDALYVPMTLHEGETAEITFRYSGYGNPYYPNDSFNVALIDRIAWLPWPGIRSESSQSCLLPFTQVEKGPIHYTLTYSGPGHLFTNLSAMEDGTYEGTVTGGVVLFSGIIPMESEAVPGRVYYVPNAASGKYTVPALDRMCEGISTSLAEQPQRLEWVFDDFPPEYYERLTANTVISDKIFIVTIHNAEAMDRYRSCDGYDQLLMETEYEPIYICQTDDISETGVFITSREMLESLLPEPDNMLSQFMGYFPWFDSDETPSFYSEDSFRETMMERFSFYEEIPEEKAAQAVDILVNNPAACRSFFRCWYEFNLKGGHFYGENEMKKMVTGLIACAH